MNIINWLGVGTVAATKQTNTKEIMVHMPKDSPTADGRTLAEVQTKEETAVNANGEPIGVTVLIGNTKPAKWSSMGEPNRLTAPDVREGSQVSLYQVTGQSTIYWTTYGFSAETHRLETIVWGFQANPNTQENTEFNVENFYTVTADTRAGFFSLRTSQSNGENSGFEIKVNGMEGKLEIAGTNRSMIIVDDFNSKFTYLNKHSTIIAVDNKKIGLIAPDSLLLNAETIIRVKTARLVIQADTIDIKADSITGAVPTTTWQGDINITGNLKATGKVVGQTDVTTATVSLNNHPHTGVRSGPDQSGPPVPGPI